MEKISDEEIKKASGGVIVDASAEQGYYYVVDDEYGTIFNFYPTEQHAKVAANHWWGFSDDVISVDEYEKRFGIEFRYK